MAETLKLDPQEYGDLERFVALAEEVSRVTCDLQKAIWGDTPDMDLILRLMAEAEDPEMLAKATACSAFSKAYEGSDDADGNLPKRVIAEHITNLLDSYPSHRINNPRVYIQTLVEEIYSEGAWRAVIELTCRELKRTCKTPPPLATVLEVLSKRQTKFSALDWAVQKTLEYAREELDDLRQKQAELAACPYLQVGHRVKTVDGRLGTVVKVQDCSGAQVRIDGQPGSTFYYDPSRLLTFADGRPVLPQPKQEATA